ncbi:hypothetical protein EDD75_0312 [Thermodesulfitimonas autotrophica]|uniref:Uncharacterized protein n=1 Tax=Thermodesulfitimonas autotrophica TaxID=1894989 RepID=A0A3N5AWA0_9THEO|nr:hypothetical protein [Thermodesulfitimonas autotrophica]RPF49496.1 hypothetical protein EDD75_0312 [Thermodesulfitimonas autotrophica]
MAIEKVPTKADVLAFIRKARREALDSIDSVYAEKAFTAFKAALAEGGFSETLKKIQECLNDLAGCLRALVEKPESPWLEYAHLYRSIIPQDDAVADIEKLLFDAALYGAKVPGLEAVQEIRAEWNRKLEETRNAYGALENRLRLMRNPKKMIKFLNDLGFDTGCLLEKEINAEALFFRKQ